MFNKIIFLVLIIASIFTKNKSMVLASIITLIFSFSNSQPMINFLKKYLLDGGMTLLMIWMLLPLIDYNKNYSITRVKDLININGIVSMFCGIFVVIIASKGINYLKDNTSVLGGVVTGSIIGVTFLGGVPVGPLIASGIAYIMIKFITHIMNSLK